MLTANENLDKVYNLYRERIKGSIIRNKDYFLWMQYNIDLAKKYGIEVACLLDYINKFNFLSLEELKELILPSEYKGENFDKYLNVLKDNGLIESEC